MSGERLETARLRSIHEVDPAEWDALVDAGGDEACPFFEHAFLSSLEDSGCVGSHAGWHPRYVVVRRAGRLVGGVSLFRKDHSNGEFIFDWSWADAAHRAGLPYYPKLIVAAPFSPVGGRRFLLAEGEGAAARDALLNATRDVAEDEPATGVHWLFTTGSEAEALSGHGLAVRHTHQFQWRNEGFRDFDDFLERFRSKRRNQIRRERRRVRESGVVTRVLEGDALGPEHARLCWQLYVSTVDKFFWGKRYLNERFFQLLVERFAHRLLLVVAERDGQVLAGTVNVRRDPVLYGRYWGCFDEDVPNLHFEVCSYAGIDAAIERGLGRFEAGAGGGGHKWGRGFLPTTTYSAHEIYLPPLDRAVRMALAEERADLAHQLRAAEGRVLK